MVRYSYTVRSNKLLVASSTQTLLQYAPSATHPAILNAWQISVDGSAAATGILVQLVTQTTAGTGGASPPTPRAKDPNVARASQGTITHNHTAEPTLGVLIWEKYLQPFGGLIYVQYPVGQELLVIEGGDRLGLRVITAAGVTPNCAFGFEYTE